MGAAFCTGFKEKFHLYVHILKSLVIMRLLKKGIPVNRPRKSVKCGKVGKLWEKFH